MMKFQRIEMVKRLKELRKQTGNLSQQDVADLLGMERSSFSKYETGVANPSMNVLVKLCDLYGVGIDELLGEKENSVTFREKSSGESGEDPNLRFGNLTKSETLMILKMRLMDEGEREKLEKLISDEAEKYTLPVDD